VGLVDLFDGRRQLIIYHFMFAPGDDAGCERCSFVADNIGHLSHLHARDTSLILVSHAPLAEIAPFKARMGWIVPWVSSFGSDFNQDFGVTTNDGERFGLSVFLRDGDRIFRTYFTNGRGVDGLLTTYTYLDLTPLGRQEDWEESPAGWPQTTDGWVRRHDETTPSACASGTQTDKREGDRDVLNPRHWCAHKERENDRNESRLAVVILRDSFLLLQNIRTSVQISKGIPCENSLFPSG
jgi:hypothetical protein